MPIYNVGLVAEIYKDVQVEADSFEDAKEKARRLLDSSEIRIAPQELWFAIDAEEINHANI